MYFTAWIVGECIKPDRDTVIFPFGYGQSPNQPKSGESWQTGWIFERSDDFFNQAHTEKFLIISKDKTIKAEMTVEFERFEDTDIETARLRFETETECRLTPKPAEDYPYLLTNNLNYRRIFDGKIQLEWIFHEMGLLMLINSHVSYAVACQDWIGILKPIAQKTSQGIPLMDFPELLESDPIEKLCQQSAFTLIAFSDRADWQIDGQDLYLITNGSASDVPLFKIARAI